MMTVLTDRVYVSQFGVISAQPITTLVSGYFRVDSTWGSKLNETSSGLSTWHTFIFYTQSRGRGEPESTHKLLRPVAWLSSVNFGSFPLTPFL